MENLTKEAFDLGFGFFEWEQMEPTKSKSLITNIKRNISANRLLYFSKNIILQKGNP